MGRRKWDHRGPKVVARTVRPDEPISLGEILFPCRFDLIKRAEFVPFYLEHKALWEQDKAAFVALAKEQRTITYLHPIATSQRYREFFRAPTPWTEREIQRRADRLLAKNSRVLSELYHSIVEGGWNPLYPVRLKRLLNPAPYVSGRPITNDVVYSDGQHRVIILISQGQRELRPDQYQIAEISSRFDGLETTDCYIEHGLCTEAEFCDFARWRYPVPEEIEDTYSLYQWGMDNNIAPWWERYMRDYWEETWHESKM